MAGMAHIGLGLAAKRVAPKVPVVVLALAAEALDILWGLFALTGIESMEFSPWSHGFFMALVWSLAAGVLAAVISHHKRTGLVIGLVVFSHWALDFITHPMGFISTPSRGLPLFFEGSPFVGLGAYQNVIVATIIEFGVVILGAVSLRKRGRAPAAPVQQKANDIKGVEK